MLLLIQYWSYWVWMCDLLHSVLICDQAFFLKECFFLSGHILYVGQACVIRHAALCGCLIRSKSGLQTSKTIQQFTEVIIKHKNML